MPTQDVPSFMRVNNDHVDTSVTKIIVIGGREDRVEISQSSLT